MARLPSGANVNVVNELNLLPPALQFSEARSRKPMRFISMELAGERAGNNISFWERTAEKFRSAPLSGNLDIDVCVIGAGIAGMSTAYMLAREGRSVAIIDDGPVGGGMTGRTTAHLVNALDDRYYELEKILGEEAARAVAESHTEAINRIDEIVREEDVHCDFERLDGYLFLPEGAGRETIDKEYDATLRARLLEIERIAAVPIIQNISGPALRFPRQAQFHPLKYLNGLADAITRRGGKIFTGNRVTSVAGGDMVQLETREGHKVTARAVVVATNSPINDRYVIHTKQAPYSTYVLGFRVERGVIPRALFWDTAQTATEEKQLFGPTPYHYVRLAPDGAHDVLLVGGEDHKSAQAFDFEARFANLEEWTRRHFPAAGEITDRWSGQVMEPVDGPAYIGPDPAGDKNVYVVTGDSGNGMTHGTIAGILLTDLITGRQNRWAEIYDPKRKTLKPLVIGDYLKENANVVAQLRDYLTSGDVPEVDDIAPGEGALIREGLKKIAAYRDDSGALHKMSAVCPHLKCIVRWNATEKTWDCPCHGSRFDCTGTMVNGPSSGDLEPV
jgi:glycine/D-amino acid oxidase-like deaminating enzyme/nitrite reductase/ring-hydroxylating ferredoxin subunit